jgi:fumarate hydratase class II
VKVIALREEARTMKKKSKERIERDSMGQVSVPADAYYGASTRRAVLNFPVSGLRFSRRFLRVLGLIKWGAARINQELGLLEPRLAEVIANRAAEILGGRRGSRGAVHPNDQVNLGQSSNDVIPTTIDLSCSLALNEVLDPSKMTRPSE